MVIFWLNNWLNNTKFGQTFRIIVQRTSFSFRSFKEMSFNLLACPTILEANILIPKEKNIVVSHRYILNQTYKHIYNLFIKNGVDYKKIYI